MGATNGILGQWYETPLGLGGILYIQYVHRMPGIDPEGAKSPLGGIQNLRLGTTHAQALNPSYKFKAPEANSASVNSVHEHAEFSRL